MFFISLLHRIIKQRSWKSKQNKNPSERRYIKAIYTYRLNVLNNIILVAVVVECDDEGKDPTYFVIEATVSSAEVGATFLPALLFLKRMPYTIILPIPIECI